MFRFFILQNKQILRLRFAVLLKLEAKLLCKFLVTVGDKLGYIDKQGKYIWKPTR